MHRADALFWGPNWTESPKDEFRARLCAVISAVPDGWVVDGNYDSRLGDLVVDTADTIVWLDLPLWVKSRRLWGRTLHRVRGGAELWNGNRETWRGAFFARDSSSFG